MYGRSQIAALAGFALVGAFGMSVAHATNVAPPGSDQGSKVAKYLFEKEKTPSPGPSQPIGFYSRGCLQGGKALPLTGPTWQVMRPDRDRYWGTPQLLAFIERVSHKAAAEAGIPGLLVGDMAQPRGGPMESLHASHQIGLDVDFWFSAMPNHTLSHKERETTSATSMVSANKIDTSAAFTPARMAELKAVAQDPEVDRIFVNPAIKRTVCKTATGDRAWLNKVHPLWGHRTHFHVRLYCPRGASQCKPQQAYRAGDGCGKTLAYWFSDAILHPKPNPNYRPKPPITLAQLPKGCSALVEGH